MVNVDLSVMYGFNPEDPKMHIFYYYILLDKRHNFLQLKIIEFNPQALSTFLNLLKTSKLYKDRLYILKAKRQNFFHYGSLSSPHCRWLYVSKPSLDVLSVRCNFKFCKLIFATLSFVYGN